MVLPTAGESSSGGDEQAPPAQRRLIITLVAVTLVFLFASWFAWFMFRPEASWKNAEFEATVNRFQYNVMLARAEWIRQGQPAEVRLSLAELNAQNEPVIRSSGIARVPMSREGWPLARGKGEAGCLELWHLLGRPELNQGVVNSQVKVKFEVEQCHFYFLKRLRFVFSPENGRVEQII
ncbi:hypothetical protein [Aliidiomarina celeris]|uniref:hypothetical protein n=1 Tax=Aliidiomarina celeris TaxID=2249428 RepID=UPI000DEAEBD8|nr:hypothetical protein [Aliidiomarina celeris]